jgi:hypothetical protein
MQKVRMSLQTTLADVIGPPSTWPDYSWNREGKRANMRGACISEFAESHDGIAIATSGGIDGPTYTAFFIEDLNLKKRVMRVLRVGLSVHIAAKLPV